jgi:hypothetical protein
MLPAPLPFDYVQYLDRGDRIRRAQMQTKGGRERRAPFGTSRSGE